jgi:hypothetical protein
VAEYLLPMTDAFRRFMPEVTRVADRTMTYSRLDRFKAGIVEGDLHVPSDRLILMAEMVPAFKDAPLGALFVMEARWYLDHHSLWLVRLQCLMACAIGVSFGTAIDAANARAALDLAQCGLDRFLLPVNSDWHANASAAVRNVRFRIPV